MRVVESTLPFHRRCQSIAAALSLAHHAGKMEAPSTSPWSTSRRPTRRRDGSTLRQLHWAAQTLLARTSTRNLFALVCYSIDNFGDWIFRRVSKATALNILRSFASALR